MTERNPKIRWNNGKGYRNSPIFYCAIKKYGWDRFKHYIIASNLTKSEAQNFEKLLIQSCKTQNIEYGYNMADGGTGGNQKPIKSVNQYDLDGNYIATYKSAAEAARSLGINRSRITGCCRGREKSAIGYLWHYENDPVNKYVDEKTTQVDMYDLDGNFIRTFESMQMASDFINASNSSAICENCRRVIYSCYGYRWAYHGNSIRELNSNKKQVTHYDDDGNILNVYESMFEAKQENKISYNDLYKLLKKDPERWRVLGKEVTNVGH